MPSAAGLIMPSKSGPPVTGVADHKGWFAPKLFFAEPQAAQPNLFALKLADRTGRPCNGADLLRRDRLGCSGLKEESEEAPVSINRWTASMIELRIDNRKPGLDSQGKGIRQGRKWAEVNLARQV